MKKIIVVLLLLLNIVAPVYAGFWEKIDKFFYVPTPQEQFNKLEELVRQESYSNLQKNLDDFWNLKSEKFTNGELKKQIKEYNVKNFPDMFIQDKKGLEEYRIIFSKNKNNMAQNRAIYESIKEDFIDVYNKFEKLFTEEIYKKEFYNYQETLYEKNKNIHVNPVYIDHRKYDYIYDYNGTNSATGLKNYRLRETGIQYYDRGVKVIGNWQQFKAGFLEQEQPVLQNILSIVDENIKNAKKIHDEIANYSIAYETKKLENYYKSRYGNIKNAGDISNVILRGTSPQAGCYYDADSLEVLQVISGGVIARDCSWGSNRIFIATNRKFADGDNYSGRLLYKGIYKYTSVLGAPVTIRKYQEIPLPQENFYFIYK